MPSLRASLPARDRDYDFSNIGKVGRRTGVTLAPQKLDQHGLEEVSGLFSSPKKPSPLKRGEKVLESVEEEFDHATPRSRTVDPISTPTTNVSVARSIQRSSAARLRSASPKKSGITGTARRSNDVDIMAQKQQHSTDNTEDTQISSPRVTIMTTRASSARPATTAPYRFSPNGTPFAGRALRGSKTTQAVRMSDIQPTALEEDINDEGAETPSRVHIEQRDIEQPENTEDAVEVMGDNEVEQQSILPGNTEAEVTLEGKALADEDDDEDDDATYQSPKPDHAKHNQPTAANSRRKRRSSAVEDLPNPISSPATKRRKGHNSDETPVNSKQASGVSRQIVASKKSRPNSKLRGRPPLQNKSNNIKLSARQEKQVADAIETIRARPGGAAKTLHLLRRETPNDDTALRTRTGRLSVKPLAYWRNERVIFTNAGDDASTGLADGGRFPLNTVSYVHRIDETIVKPKAKKPGKRKGNSSKLVRTGKLQADDDDSDIDFDGGRDDPNMAEWETNPGTMTGEVAVWDSEHQVHGNITETVEIAHASGAIETNEVKGSTFRFAKLLSTPFFGTGVVDLPPGGVKKVKNSRKMHMTFFVCSGRVTVDVGPPGGEETRFSIGKGGYWQVPRGNNYAILNENGKDARLFFSQACEMAATMPEE